MHPILSLLRVYQIFLATSSNPISSRNIHFNEICDGGGWYFSSPSNQHPLTGSNFDFESEWGAASGVKDATQINLIFTNWEFSQLRLLSSFSTCFHKINGQMKWW